MHVSVRVPKNMSAEEQAAYLKGLDGAVNGFCTQNPLSSHGQPQILIELFPSALPYTDAGEVRGFADCGRANEWWTCLITALMEQIQAQSENRGVVLYTPSQATHRIAALDTCKVA